MAVHGRDDTWVRREAVQVGGRAGWVGQVWERFDGVEGVEVVGGVEGVVVSFCCCCCCLGGVGFGGSEVRLRLAGESFLVDDFGGGGEGLDFGGGAAHEGYAFLDEG